MIEIRNIKIPVDKDIHYLEKKIIKKLRLNEIPEYEILKKSIDARKKPDIYYIYQIGVFLDKNREINLVKRLRDKDVVLNERTIYNISDRLMENPDRDKMKHHPLIIGAGPAGLFCAYILAKYGYAPIVVERGSSIEKRVEKVNRFWEKGILDTECNVQFGEGGAGTFSDGKLNTQVKEKYGRIRFVLEKFVKHGAAPSILYDSKPHIGTDVLVSVISGMRKEIEELGGRFLFDTKMSEIIMANNDNIVDNSKESDKALSDYPNRIIKVRLSQKDSETIVETNHVILAIGHSARDTFSMLYDNKVSMLAKDFAMGVRIEHPEKLIRDALYGKGEAGAHLPSPPYKLTYKTQKGRGVYSFCMCPGGYVVNASSEEGYTAVNGMSYSGRNGANSNSALIVTVRRDDYESDSPLAGISLQRKLEKAIYEQGEGKIPVQKYIDFKKGVATKELGSVLPQTKGEYICGNVAGCLPDYIKDSIVEAMTSFNKNIPGFDNDDAIVSGVESRTSSPVRILRNDNFQSEGIKGLYPCGEGAGYAGGIMSAAMDGMKAAEAVMSEYKPQ